MESTPSLRRETSQSTLCVHAEPKKEPVSTATPLLDLDDATPVPQGWPTSPNRVKHSLSMILLNMAFDIFLFAFSSCFLVFSLVVMHYNGAPTSENPTATNVLARATKYGPTVFPLLFASVVGRATHAILLWRLEKGERIKILDMLATSTSLTSTVTSQIHLRQLSVLSVLLVATWALSPIGGQASLRQMTIETVAKRSDASFQYVVPVVNDMKLRTNDDPHTANIFTTAMFAASTTKPSPVDLWGNVKVPKIEYYEKKSKPDINGWLTTGSEDDQLAAYSSFVGIRIDGAQHKTTTTNYHFPIHTQYLQLTCATASFTGFGDFPRVYLPPDARNITGGSTIIWWSGDDVENRSQLAFESLVPFNFSYVNRLWDTDTSVSCSVETSYVEVEVWCAVNSTCRAAKVRRSQLPQIPPAFTLLEMDDMLIWENLFYRIVDSIVNNLASTFDDSFGIYLANASLKMASDEGERDPTLVSDEVWSYRFGRLLNSYWTCLYSMYTVTGEINADTSFFWATNTTFQPYDKIDWDGPNIASNYKFERESTLKSKVWTSQGSKYEHVEVMVAHIPWAITLAITSLVLIAFSLIPPLVRHFLTNGPDIAMNFSSLATRNNSHIPIPAGGSFLPAADRFRLLRDVRLRFADAEGKSDVGNLVIASEGVEKAEFAGVRKERLYE
ncbi:hypothetical protein ACET3X_005598 [Alternaria dauci]|uniref:Uncharacterized protein n=1 Tax=Alternaria dauci TaxID=48095 RepID=A0ABR3UKR9_9PLEO